MGNRRIFENNTLFEYCKRNNGSKASTQIVNGVYGK